MRLVLDGEAFTQLHEVLAGDRLLVAGLDGLAFAALVRGDEILDVGQARVDAHTVVVLHAAFRWQAVVVPAHRVEDGLTGHALEAGDDVGVRVGEHVADVEGARDRRRGSVDRVDLFADRGAIEGVDAVFLPGLAPFGFKAFSADALGHLRGGN